MKNKNKYTIISLGCPKNLVDSEKFHTIIRKCGYEYTQNQNMANLILINTCGFIKEAQEEAVQTILNTALLKKKRLKTLIVTGCLVQRYRAELIKEIPEVDYWIDLKDFGGLEEVLSPPYPPHKCGGNRTIPPTFMGGAGGGHRTLLTPSHYAYLRISDGCNNRCSYCTIPSIRGQHKSEPIEVLVEEAKYLASQGVKELIINAQDTTMYGHDLYGKPMLIDLLKEIENMHLFPWIRLLYLHPAHLDEQTIIDLTHIKSLLPYFDIPLQHINDETLQAMNRKIDKKSIINRLNLLRKHFPDCAIRTTFITGFPGETTQNFRELKSFIKDFGFTRLGVFAFSCEEGTPAAKMTAQVSQKTAQYRKDKLMSIQQEISAGILSEFRGKTLDVIVDKVVKNENNSPPTPPHGGGQPTPLREGGLRGEFPYYQYEARSYLDAPEIDGTVFITNGDLQPGDIVTVEITDTWEYDMIGRI